MNHAFMRIDEVAEHAIGKYGRMRLRYLKNHHKVMYTNLLTSGALNSHLHEVDEAAANRMEMIVRQMAASEGVDERFKAENQILWVQHMNNIRNRAEEIVISEEVYG